MYWERYSSKEIGTRDAGDIIVFVITSAAQAKRVYDSREHVLLTTAINQFAKVIDCNVTSMM